MKTQLIPSGLWMMVDAFGEDMPLAHNTKVYNTLGSAKIGAQQSNSVPSNIVLMATKDLGNDMHYILICTKWWKNETEIYFAFRNPQSDSYRADDDFEIPTITPKFTSAIVRSVCRLIPDGEGDTIIDYRPPLHESEGEPIIILSCATRIELTGGWVSTSRKQTLLAWYKDNLRLIKYVKSHPRMSDSWLVEYGNFKVHEDSASMPTHINYNKCYLGEMVKVSDKERKMINRSISNLGRIP
jgi:hypothetical protein